MVSFALEKLVSLVSFHLLVVVQSLGGVWLFVTPWTAACQASLSFTISKSLLKLMSSPWCHSTISSLLPPSPPVFNLSQHQGLSQRVSSSHQVDNVLELQHQSFQWIFKAGFLYHWLLWSLQSKGLSRVFSNTRVQKRQFFSAQPSLWSTFHICMWLLEIP